MEIKLIVLDKNAKNRSVCSNSINFKALYVLLIENYTLPLKIFANKKYMEVMNNQWLLINALEQANLKIVSIQFVYFVS